MAQLSFEHYEKMTDTALSLEGKANYLSPIIQRNNLSSPLLVFPCSPVGTSATRSGGSSSTTAPAAVTNGSTSRRSARARRSPRARCDWASTRDLDRDGAIDLGALAIYEAGDNDPSTGGTGLRAQPLPDDRHDLTATASRSSPTTTSRERFRAINERRTQSGRRRRGIAAMSNYFYVAPEQLIRDRAEFAQKGIARGRSIVGAIFDTGVVLVAENPSASLFKISEIYDRIAFAGVGKYNEFDRLREAGIRWADGTGFTYSRGDVDARALANYYAQHLGDMFTEGQKPLEVEILVAQLGNQTRTRPSSTASPTRAPSPTSHASRCWAATPRRSRPASRPPRTRSRPSTTTLKNAVGGAGGTGPHHRGQRPRGRASSKTAAAGARSPDSATTK